MSPESILGRVTESMEGLRALTGSSCEEEPVKALSRCVVVCKFGYCQMSFCSDMICWLGGRLLGLVTWLLLHLSSSPTGFWVLLL